MNMNIGARIKAHREQANLQQDTVAAYLGVDQSYVAAVENGECVITAKQQELLDELYGGNPEVLANPRVTTDDMHAIAVVNHIAANSRYMARLLKNA